MSFGDCFGRISGPRETDQTCEAGCDLVVCGQCINYVGLQVVLAHAASITNMSCRRCIHPRPSTGSIGGHGAVNVATSSFGTVGSGGSCESGAPCCLYPPQQKNQSQSLASTGTVGRA